MKKVIALILSVIFLTAACGCSAEDEQTKADAENSGSVVINMPEDDSVNGYRISAKEGRSIDTAQSESIASSTKADGITLYYANTSSKKFHKSDCSFASRILDKNLYISESRDELIGSGYEPCSVCNP